jgi:preprotein translocase subunit SecA
VIGTAVGHACPPNKHFEDWDSEGLKRAHLETFDIDPGGAERLTDAQEIAEKLFKDARAVLDKREHEVGELLYLRVFRNFFLQEIDNQWLEHLQAMEGLRDGIGLRGYGQRDPKKEYQKEGFSYFLELMQGIKTSVVQKMFHFVIEREDEVERLEAERRRRVEQRQANLNASHATAPTPTAEDEEQTGEDGAGEQPGPAQPAVASRAARRRMAATAGGQAAEAPAPKMQTVKHDKPKLGRNDPCWCGSGKKYKSCHLRSDEDAQTGTA